MMIKYSSFLRNLSYFKPLYFISMTRREYYQKRHEERISQIKKTINDYLFQKYSINQQIQHSLGELEKSLLSQDEQYSTQELIALRKTFANVQTNLATQSTIKQFKSILKIAKEKDIMTQIQLLQSNLDLKQRTQTSTTQIIKKYLSLQQSNRKVSKIVLKEIQQNIQEQILIQDCIEVFQKFINLQVLSNSQRTIRIILMRKIKQGVANASLKQLVRIGKNLNRVSHYDFSLQELITTQQIFKKLLEKASQIKDDIEVRNQLFKGIYHPLNILNLSLLYKTIIESLISSVKRANSAGAHEVFNLIAFSGQSIKQYIQKGTKLQLFLLRYVQVNGKTKKHNENINTGLYNLLSKNCLSLKTVQQLTNILFQVDFSPTVNCLYHLIVNDKNSITKFMDIEKIDKFMFVTKFIDWQKQLDLFQLFMYALAIHKSGSSIFQKTKYKLDATIQSWFLKFLNLYKNKISQHNKEIHNILFHFGSIYQKLHLSMIDKPINFFIEYQQQLRIYYLIGSFKFQQEQILILNRVINQNQILLIKLLQERLTNNSNEALQNYLIAAYFISNLNNSQLFVRNNKPILSLVIRLSKKIRQNNICKAVKFHYWMQVTCIVDKIPKIFAQSKEQLFTLVELLLSDFNNYNSEYWFNGDLYCIFQKILSQYAYFQSQDHIKHLIVKIGLSFNLINQGHPILDTINLQNFDLFNIQKIKYLKDSQYCSMIDEINEQTVQLILFNHNNHDLLNQYKQEIKKIIKNTNNKQLQRYIINFNQQSFERSSPYKLADVVKALAENLEPSILNGYTTFKQFDNKQLFQIESSKIILQKWINYFVGKPQKVGDQQTHTTILTLLTKYHHQQIHSISKYIQILFKQLKIYPTNFNKQIFYLKFIRLNYKFQKQQLEKLSLAQQSFSIPFIFFYLQHQFQLHQRVTLLHKIQKNIQRQHQNTKQNIKIISYQQYRYLQQKYPNYITIKIPEINFEKQIFSSFNEENREILNQIALFKNTKLIRLTNFGDNQIYQMKDNYIINLEPFKQSSCYELSYYERLLKAFYGSNIKVTITFFQQQDEHLDTLTFAKLNSLLTQQQWKVFLQNRAAIQHQKVEQHQLKHQQTHDKSRKKKKQAKKHQNHYPKRKTTIFFKRYQK